MVVKGRVDLTRHGVGIQRQANEACHAFSLTARISYQIAEAQLQDGKIRTAWEPGVHLRQTSLECGPHGRGF
jgi:hypothetical protein